MAKPGRRIVTATILILLGVSLVCGAYVRITNAGKSFNQPYYENAGVEPAISHLDPYALLLEKYVHDGMVDYKALKDNRDQLDAYVRSLATVGREEYKSWSDKQKIAFWINAYNAITLKVIIDHYPISASRLRSLVFPKNSIRQIKGVWDNIQHDVMGKKMTLNYIEHEILLKKFNEPRIHLALVCAAQGCPPLRSEPFSAEHLDEQFTDQANTFLRDKRKFFQNRDESTIYLSSIFKWFGNDFVKQYGTNEHFIRHDAEQRAVLNFISQHLDEEDKSYLLGKKFKIEYLDYDWSLNELKSTDK